jgi:hypothetical protein
MIRTCSYQKNRRGAFAAFLVLAAMAAVPMPMWGQWNGTNPVWTNSNVGIGTTTPAARLDLNVPGGTAGLRIADGGTEVFTVKQSTASPWPIMLDGGTNRPIVLQANSTGNVGIGTTNPGSFKLAVEGTIGARDVMVTSTNPWPDYVFRPGYRLRPLSEVSQFIRENGHLPDIPTEAEVKEKGVSLGDMQAKLLAKVEELTLHMIQQENENRELRDQMNRQTKEMQELRERLGRPEKGVASDLTPAAAK